MVSELQEVGGTIEQVSTKDGETNGKPWKKYGYKVAGSWYNGWGEPEFGEGDDVIITYHIDRYGYAVNQVRDANATPVPKVERPMDMEPDKEIADAAEEKCQVNIGKPPESNALAEQQPQLPAPKTPISTGFEGMLAQADTLLKSGLLPAEIKTPAAALAVILTGKELGIPMMQSLRSIYIVKGKPTMSAQLIGARIFQAGHKYVVVESSDQKCTLEFTRKGEKPVPYTFTMEDAARAGLNNDTWKKYPKAMLFSRAMSAGARMVMPDVISGVYTPEEIADRVEVDAETGEQKPVVQQ